MEIIMKKLFVVLLVFTSVLFSQWDEVTIFPFSGSIHQFYMTDSLNITALFYPGVADSVCSVIKSNDGGRSWSFSQILPLAYIVHAQFIDENNIFASMGYSYMNSSKKTTDGGITWTNVSFPSRYVSLNDVQFINPEVAYASVDYKGPTGNPAMLLKTTDGGVSWIEVDSTAKSIESVKFYNSQFGYLIGNHLLETTDGGLTFTNVPMPEGFATPTSVDLFQDSILVVGGYRNVFVPPYYNYSIPQAAFSTNRGVSWRFKDFGNDNWFGRLVQIKILNGDTAFAINDAGSGIFYTTDQGVTWSRGNSPENGYQYYDFESYENRIYLGGIGSTFVVSGNDITEPWQVRLDHTRKKPLSAAFSESGLVVVGAETGRIYVSTDKGNTFRVKLSQINTPNSTFIVNDSLIYIANLNTIYRSVDKCITIDSLVYLPSGWIHDLKVTKNGDIWLCNGNTLLSSSDNGATWITKFQGPDENFEELLIFENGTMYATDGDLYKSTDNGTTWVKINNPALSINDLEFYDSNNGFIGQKYGNYYRTTDGGLNFQLLSIPGMTYPYTIYSKDSLNIFVAANKLYSTYDGGLSWKINEFHPANRWARFTWIYMYDHFDGVGVSYYDGVWRTWNRGNTPVELSLFSALPFGNKVVLQWTTETETNNMGFEIERRDKYGDWKKIAFSKGSGTSTRKIFYGYDDYEPKAPAILYYRLKQIDYNGEFEYSNEVEVLLGEVPENYSIQQNYPNPFNPSTKVTFALPEENKVVIRVFNAMGEQVKEIDRGILSHGYFEQDFEMGTESSGMYFCQVLCTNTISGRTKSLTVKMVLMK